MFTEELNQSYQEYETWMSGATPPKSEKPVKKKKGLQEIEFVKVLRSTAKAKFFQIGEDVNGWPEGYWVPKSGIKQQLDTKVFVEKWIDLKLITFR